MTYNFHEDIEFIDDDYYPDDPYIGMLEQLREEKEKDKLAEKLIPIAQKFFMVAELRDYTRIEPDLTVDLPSKNEVDRFIEKHMTFIEDELAKNPEHWTKKRITHPPQFDKLDGGSKLAFYQEWYRVKG